MLAKVFNKKLLLLISFLSAFLGLVFFFSYKALFFSNYITPEAGKNLVLLTLTSLAILFYILFILVSKKALIPTDKYAKLLFVILAVFILASSLFSGEFTNSFFGKYVFIQSGVTYLAILSLIYILASTLKRVKGLAWLLFFIANLFVTLPTILALVISRLSSLSLANKLVYFVDNWDTVALTAGVVIIISLIYHETVATSKTQKYISAGLAILHLILVACIIIPDLWYALALASCLVLIVTKKKQVKVYKKLSFYIFLVSLLFSVMYIFSNGGWSSNLVNKYSVFVSKYSGVNYNFVKPRVGLSLQLAGNQIKEGRLLGAGPNEFYKVWQNEKSQAVVESPYWSTSFSSSYSALTTLLVTLGILGTGIVILSLVGISISLQKTLKQSLQEESFNFDQENKFYLYTSMALFVFAILIFIFFTNVSSALILLAVSSALALSNTLTWQEKPSFKTHSLVFLILLVATLLGSLQMLDKARSAKVISLGLMDYQKTNDLKTLEDSLLKAIKISGNDINYRLLSNFYLSKTQNILQTISQNASSSPDVLNNLKQTAGESVNQALASAQKAIEIDKQDYNNYLTLANLYSFLMSNDSQNKEVNYQKAKEAYAQAVNLYPKNPAIYLTLAQLEFNYSQNASSTKNNLDKSLLVKPNYSEAYYVYSQLAITENDKVNAIKYAAQAIQANPNNVDAYIQYGTLVLDNAKLTSEDLNQAYAAFTSVLRLDPNNLLAGYYLAVTYTLAGDYENAEKVLTLLKQALPDNPKLLELETFLKTNPSAQKNSATQTTKSEESQTKKP